MFTHPGRLGQLAREHHHDMLAQASPRSLRSQLPAAPNAAARITRRLAGAIGRAGVVASRAADTI
jgi:hypothetical protein